MKLKRILCLFLAVVAGGSVSRAGSLEPPGPPAPTMVSLESLPASWHQQLGLARFELVLNDEAVLDHETGLVWQRTVREDVGVWTLAVVSCRLALIGNRYGWRLPSVEELATLMDPDQSSPALPPLHPFVAEAAAGGAGEFTSYWTTSSWIVNDLFAWVVRFDVGDMTSEAKTVDRATWCVRGSVALDTGKP
jgi:hypothetical protein